MSHQTNPKISSTGFRLFVLLQFLMQEDRAKVQIFDFFNKNYSNLNMSPDILRLDINTLKIAGFDITTGERKDKYKYSLNWNPLKISLTKSEINVLNQIKNLIIQSADIKTIINLHNLFEKIAKFVNVENAQEKFLNFGYFHNVDFKLIKELSLYCENKKCIEILYNSPNSGKKHIKIKCHNLIHDKNTNKIHLWCFAKGYNEGKLAYFRADNIIKISKNIIPDEIEYIEPEKCRFRLVGRSKKEYSLQEGDKIIKNTEEFIEIEGEILTEFHFVQRILAYGEDCIWVDNANIREQILEKLYQIRAIYG